MQLLVCFFSQVLETIGSVDCIHTVKKKLVNASDNSLVCSTSEASFFYDKCILW
jgi:hypothetical protein